MNLVRGHPALATDCTFLGNNQGSEWVQLSTILKLHKTVQKKNCRNTKSWKYSAISMGSENMPGKIPADKSDSRVELNNI